MYKVRVTETLAYTVEVDAINNSHAISQAEKMYYAEQIKLDRDNLAEIAFDIYSEKQDFTLDNIQNLKLRKVQEMMVSDDMTEVDNDIVAFLTQHRYIVLDILDDVLYGRDKDE